MLVKEQDVRATLEKGVRSREASETTTDDDNLGHCDNEERMDGGAGMRDVCD